MFSLRLRILFRKRSKLHRNPRIPFAAGATMPDRYFDPEGLARIGNMELVGRIRRELDSLRQSPDFPPGLELGLSGSAAVGTDMLYSAEESIRSTERTTIFLVLVILLAVYRAPGLVAVPLATIFVSLAVAMGLVAWIAQASDAIGWLDYKIFKTTRIFIVVILFGAGTDFCLFLIARYKEELQQGLNPGDAIARALGRVGGALAASAMTTSVSAAKRRSLGSEIQSFTPLSYISCAPAPPGHVRASAPDGSAVIFAAIAAHHHLESRAPLATGRAAAVSPRAISWW